MGRMGTKGEGWGSRVIEPAGLPITFFFTRQVVCPRFQTRAFLRILVSLLGSEDSVHVPLAIGEIIFTHRTVQHL